MKNKYIRHAKLTEAKTREIIKYFALDLTATQITALTDLNLKSVDLLINKMRAHFINQ